jgi:hypothetical protein
MRTGFFLVTAAAVSAFLPLSAAQAREAFTAVLSANGESRTYSYNSIEDAIDSVSGGDVPADVANGRALLINDYAASPVQARAPSLVAVAECAA